MMGIRRALRKFLASDDPDIEAVVSGGWEELPALREASIRINALGSGSQAKVVLAYAYYAEGNLPDAARALQAALSMDPGLVRAHHLLGTIWADQGAWDEAERCYRAALALDPSQAEIHYALAKIYTELHRYPAAVQECTAAAQRRPEMAQAHLLLGQLYFEMGEPLRAAEAYTAALRADPQLSMARYRLAAIYLEHDRQPDAVAQCQAVLRYTPQNATARLLLGNLYRAQGDDRRALDEYQTVVRLFPGLVEPHSSIADVLFDQGRDPEAMLEYRAALALSGEAVGKDAAPCHVQLGRLYLCGGQLTEAVEEFRAAAVIEPNRPDAYYALGEAFRLQAEFIAAIGAYRKALELDPGLRAEREKTRDWIVIPRPIARSEMRELPPVRAFRDRRGGVPRPPRPQGSDQRQSITVSNEGVILVIGNKE